MGRHSHQLLMVFQIQNFQPIRIYNLTIEFDSNTFLYIQIKFYI